jgi:hypothetical protein
VIPIAPFDRPYIATSSGRDALGRILTYLRLRAEDEVWITTALGARDRQVSPCVTATVARHCRFAFQPGPRTGAVLVVHDYGVPHPQLAGLREWCRHHGRPLIEDAAHAFASTDTDGRRMGAQADFALFSLPKFFAVPRGGLVVGLPGDAAGAADDEVAARFRSVLPRTAEIAARRRRNWRRLDWLFTGMGLVSALPLTDGSVPSLYVLRTEHQFAAVRRLRAAGIECGPDIHCGQLFLPCHQGVLPDDMSAIAALAVGAPVPTGSTARPRPPVRLRLIP